MGSGSVRFTGRVLFGSIRFRSGSCTLFTFVFGSVLGKTWLLVRFVLTEFEFFPISNFKKNVQHKMAGFRNVRTVWPNTAGPINLVPAF